MMDDRKLISQIIKLEDDIGILQRAYAVANDSWKQQQSELQEYHELTLAQTAKIRELNEENALLRKVADAARALAPSEMYQYTRHLFNLKHTLDEYDKAKEGQVEMGEYGGTCAYQIPPSKIDISMGDKNDL